MNDRGESVQLRKKEWGRRLQKDRLRLVDGICKEGHSLLDYGCGQGVYVDYFRSNKVSAYGVDLLEYSEWESFNSRDNEGRPFLQTISTERTPFPDSFFDSVISFEVLEHCPEPEKNLEEMIRVSKENLFLSVPDCRIQPKLNKHCFAYTHWTDTTHVNHFEEDTFLEFLGRHDLEIVSVNRAVELDLNKCYWNHVPMPSIMRKCIITMMSNFCKQDYWSSILVHAKVRNDSE